MRGWRENTPGDAGCRARTGHSQGTTHRCRTHRRWFNGRGATLEQLLTQRWSHTFYCCMAYFPRFLEPHNKESPHRSERRPSGCRTFATVTQAPTIHFKKEHRIGTFMFTHLLRIQAEPKSPSLIVPVTVRKIFCVKKREAVTCRRIRLKMYVSVLTLKST